VAAAHVSSVPETPIRTTHVRFEVKDAVGTITFTRPDRLNSLTFESYAELRDLFAQLQHHDEVRAVVVTGEGRGFCSGGDVESIIGELFARDTAGLVEFTRMTGALIGNIKKLRKPVVAALNGLAVGAGAVMAIACDFRVAAPSAKIGFIFPKVGLCGADMGAAYLLPRLIGLSKATELLFLGDPITADEALRIGLYHQVTAEGETLARAHELAARLASCPAFAPSMTKQMLEAEQGMTLDQALEAEAQAQTLCMQHPDFRAAFDAWSKKVPIRFAGAPGPFQDRPAGKPGGGKP
jgi:enoyl-CoA hydratase/carnithine racemase